MDADRNTFVAGCTISDYAGNSGAALSFSCGGDHVFGGWAEGVGED